MTPEQAQKELKNDLENFHTCFMKESLRRIKAKTPVKTGALRDSFKLVGKDRIVSDKEYAAAVEFGTQHTTPRGMVRSTASESDQIASKCEDKLK